MAVSVDQSAWSANANAFETDGIETVSFGATVSSGVVYVGIMVTATNKTISSVTDDGGNTYTLSTSGGTNATSEETASATEVWIYQAPITTTMQTVTVTINSALASPARVAIIATSGQHATTPTEDTAVYTTAGTAVTSHATGPVSAAAAGGAGFGVIAGTNGTYTTSSGWTSIGATANFHAGYLTGLGSGNTTWTPTTSATENASGALVLVQAAASGTAVPVFTHNLRVQGIL